MKKLMSDVPYTRRDGSIGKMDVMAVEGNPAGTARFVMDDGEIVSIPMRLFMTLERPDFVLEVWCRSGAARVGVLTQEQSDELSARFEGASRAGTWKN